MPQGTLLRSKSEAPRREGPPAPMIPFVRGAHEHLEPAGLDQTYTPGAASFAFNQFDVPAYGFLKNIVLLVTGSGGTLGAGVLHEDYPFNTFDEIVLTDVNGAPIFGPLTGYDTFLANCWGGYVWNPDVRDQPDYVGTINFSFMFRIPVEITPWDGFGSLPNQDANAAYRVRLTGAASGTMFSTAPTTAPNVRARAFMEAWSRPSLADAAKRPQEGGPPAKGSTQFWSLATFTPGAGSNKFQIKRVGNLWRLLLFIQRNATPVRSTTDWPDNFTFTWDSRQILASEPRYIRRTYMRERYGGLAGATNTIPTGVFVYDFIHDQDGHAGNESRHLYIPSLPSSRLEFEGNWANAGSTRLLICDVAPVGEGR